MNRIETQEEAQHILNIGIETSKRSREYADELFNESPDWVIVGSMSKIAGVWTYGFQRESAITMYSERYGIRREPTPQEFDEIIG